MRTESHMATRTIKQYSGDIGEVHALKELLQLGAAVNGLTASDYGWDLHVQVPSVVMNLEDDKSSTPNAWALTGRTAHVQVKRSEEGTPPNVGVDTARGWLTGSQSGTPTFILFISSETGDCDAPKLRYATPSNIADWISGLERKHGSTGLSKRHSFGVGNFVEYGRRRFAAELQLWTRYPNVMLHPDCPTPRALVPMTPLTEDLARRTMEQFALGYCAHHQLRFPPDKKMETWRAFLGFVSVLEEAGVDIDLDELADNLYSEVLSKFGNYSDVPDPGMGIPVLAYSTANDEPSTLEDAVECIRWLLGLPGHTEMALETP